MRYNGTAILAGIKRKFHRNPLDLILCSLNFVKNKGRMDENRKTVNSSGKLRRKEIRIKTQLEKR